MNLKHLVTFLLAILLIILSLSFQSQLSKFESLGLFGIFLINFFASATVLLPAPGIASVLVGGTIYHPLMVAFSSSIGAAAGDLVGFILGHSGKSLFYKKHHTTFLIVRDIFHTYGGIVIFLMAFIPNPFFDAVGLLAGFVHYSSIRFFILVLGGRLFRNIILAFTASAF